MRHGYMTKDFSLARSRIATNIALERLARFVIAFNMTQYLGFFRCLIATKITGKWIDFQMRSEMAYYAPTVMAGEHAYIGIKYAYPLLARFDGVFS